MVNPAPASHLCWRSSSAKAPVSICCTSSPRAAPDLAGLADGPLDEYVGAGAADVVGQLAGHDVDEEHPAAGAVVHAAPGLDGAVGVADHDVLAGAQAVLGHLDQHVVDAGAGPAATLALVPAQQVGQPRDLEPVGRVRGVDLPAVGQLGRELHELLRICLEPGLVGDHKS